jgi:hypothetical protein
MALLGRLRQIHAHKNRKLHIIHLNDQFAAGKCSRVVTRDLPFLSILPQDGRAGALCKRTNKEINALNLSFSFSGASLNLVTS